MQITLEIPEEFIERLILAGKNPARAALEALAIEGYRAGDLTESQVRRMLGYETRMQVHALLQQHDVDFQLPPDFAQQEIDASNTHQAERLQARSLAR